MVTTRRQAGQHRFQRPDASVLENVSYEAIGNSPDTDLWEPPG